MESCGFAGFATARKCAEERSFPNDHPTYCRQRGQKEREIIEPFNECMNGDKFRRKMKFDLSCKKHPKYKAIQAPKANCGPCWVLYHMNSSGVYVTSLTETNKSYRGDLIAKRQSWKRMNGGGEFMKAGIYVFTGGGILAVLWILTWLLAGVPTMTWGEFRKAMLERDKRNETERH
jgi:hypothetical protein